MGMVAGNCVSFCPTDGTNGRDQDERYRHRGAPAHIKRELDLIGKLLRITSDIKETPIPRSDLLQVVRDAYDAGKAGEKFEISADAPHYALRTDAYRLGSGVSGNQERLAYLDRAFLAKLDDLRA